MLFFDLYCWLFFCYACCVYSFFFISVSEHKLTYISCKCVCIAVIAQFFVVATPLKVDDRGFFFFILVDICSSPLWHLFLSLSNY